MITAEKIDEHKQYLIFKLAGQDYALDVLQVKEIIEFGSLTKVPRTPRSMLGVINLRGNVVPVMHLGLNFGLPSSPITGRTCIIVAEVDLSGERILTGIVADSVSKVMELSADETLPAPAFGTRVCADYLRGIGKSEGKLVLLLDIDKVFTSNELQAGMAIHEL